MKTLNAFIAAFALALLAQPLPAFAQDEPPLDDIELVNDSIEEGALAFEYGVPASPALAIIGATGEAIPNAANLQRFAIGIVKASEEAGGGAAGSIDISPFWAYGGTISLNEYIEGTNFSRITRRARLSAAYVEGEDGEHPARAAIGFATSLLDQSDPVVARHDGMTYSECLAFALQPAEIRTASRQLRDAMVDARVLDVIGDEPVAPSLRQQIDANLQSAREAYNTVVEPLANACRRNATEATRRAAAWDVGAAAQWRGEDAEFSSLSSAGATLWSTWMTRAHGRIEAGSDRALFRGVAHIRADIDTVEFDEQGDAFEFNRTVVALGVERIRAEQSMFSFQVSYETSDGPSGSQWDGDSYRYLLRAEAPLRRAIGMRRESGDNPFANGVWLSVGLGAIDRPGEDGDDSYLSVALRFKTPEYQSLFPHSWSAGQARRDD